MIVLVALFCSCHLGLRNQYIVQFKQFRSDWGSFYDMEEPRIQNGDEGYTKYFSKVVTDWNSAASSFPVSRGRQGKFAALNCQIISKWPFRRINADQKGFCDIFGRTLSFRAEEIRACGSVTGASDGEFE